MKHIVMFFLSIIVLSAVCEKKKDNDNSILLLISFANTSSVPDLHVSYYGDSHDLIYATNITRTWVKTTVDSAGEVGYGSSIRIDSNGKAHISYIDKTNKTLKYATNETGEWVLSTIDDVTVNSTGSPWQSTSLSLDATNAAHIIYTMYNGTTWSYSIKYATNSSGSWSVSTLPYSNNGDSIASAVDSAGKVHFSYNYGGTVYITNSSGVWTSTSVDTNNSGGYKTAIAVDLDSKVHLAYFDCEGTNFHNCDAFYNTNQSGNWVITPIVNDHSAEVSDGIALQIDGNGIAHVAYLSSDSKIKYATNTSGSFVPVSVGSTSGFFNFIGLVIHENGAISISEITIGKGLSIFSNAYGIWIKDYIKGDVYPDYISIDI